MIYIHSDTTSFAAECARMAEQALAGHVTNDITTAAIILVVGGDGFMLHTLKKMHHYNKPFYGMNCGTVGFLLNQTNCINLKDRITKAQSTVIYPLEITATDIAGKVHHVQAINDLYLLRRSCQSAKVSIVIDDKQRMEELVCDGVIIATPAGSTAYNFSVGGPIIPIDARLLALTPISPFRPRNWRGALLHNNAKIKLSVLDPQKRPINAIADSTEIKDVITVEIQESTTQQMTLLFDKDHELQERFIQEQFR